MKKRLLLLGLVCMTLAGSVQGQGFLKKLSKAVDNASKKVENVLSPSESSNKSKKNSQSEASSSSNDDYEYSDSENTEPDELSEADLKKLLNYKVTPNTKIIKLDEVESYILLGSFYDNRAFVLPANSRLLCIDSNGNIVKDWANRDEYTLPIPSRISGIPYFNSGRIIMGEGGIGTQTAFLYDTNFKVLKSFKNAEGFSFFQNGVAMIHYQEDTGAKSFYDGNYLREKVIYINASGGQIFKSLSDPMESNMGLFSMNDDTHYVRALCDGLSAYTVPIDGKTRTSYNYIWGFRDASGKIVVPAKYVAVQDFSNGYAAVAINESGTIKWGYIDCQGKMVIEPKFTYQPSRFDMCGLALVRDKEGSYMYINNKGEVVSKKYEKATPFCNGLALIETKNGQILINSKYETVSVLKDTGRYLFTENYTSKNDIANFYYDPCKKPHPGGVLFADGHIYMPVGEGYALLSEKGEFLMAGLAGPFINGLAPVIKTKPMNKLDGVGYVNMQGEWVIMFEENKF